MKINIMKSNPFIFAVLTAGIMAIAGTTVSGGGELDMLSRLEFRPRPDLAGAEAPKTIAEPTTGVIVNTASGAISEACSMARTQEGLVFRIAGNPPQIQTMIYTAQLPDTDLSVYTCFRIRTRCFGIRRSLPLYQVLTSGKTQLLESGNLFNDRRWHTVSGRLSQPLTKGGELRLDLSTDNSELLFELGELTLTTELEGDEAMFAVASAADWTGYQPVSLAGKFNAQYDATAAEAVRRHGLLIDFPTISGNGAKLDVPFQLGPADKNLIMPPVSSDLFSGKTTALGTTIDKDVFFRAARLDEIIIPLTGRSRELYALLVSDMPPVQTRYVAPTIPQQFADVDCFSVRIDYADGSHDVCFPRNIGADGFVIQGFAGAYAIPTDPARELQSVHFQNRFIGHQIGLMALTINTGAPEVIGDALRNPPPPHVATGRSPEKRPLEIRLGNGLATLKNGFYEVEFRTADGFGIAGLRNEYAPDMPIALASGGLEIEVGNKRYSGSSFNVIETRKLPDGLQFKLRSKDPALPLDLTIRATGSADGELCFRANLTNTGKQPFHGEIRFPVLDGLVLGNLTDTWLYFPKIRAVDTNLPGTFFAPVNERAFCVQFFDIYNPVSGAGIALRTKDRNIETFDYGLAKNQQGVRAFINYPADWHSIPGGGRRALVETVLDFHAGDWRRALGNYQNWVASWFKSAPTALPKHWHDAFYIRAEGLRKCYSWQVPIYDEATGNFLYPEARKLVEQYMGCPGDILHLGNWNAPEGAETLTNNSNADDGLYDPVNFRGGAEKLKAMIRQIHDDGSLVSIYTIALYLPRASEMGRKVGEKVCQIGGNGQPVADATCFFPCLDAWQDYYIAALLKVQRELNVDVIYLDCYPFGKWSNACYSKEHGHEVPLNVNRAQHRLLAKLRAQLPPHVAIWCEDPCMDYDCDLMSGNITYYYTTIHEHRAKSYDIDDAANRDFYRPLQNIQRYTMPHIKQFGFPCGWVPSGPVVNEVNALFFNGEGITDCGFMLFDAHYRARVRQWLQIQRALTDCFTSAAPKPLVRTAAGEIYANEFPGKDRTAWTLWNGRFSTYRGPVLRVPHVEGAHYYDAWNAAPITPERDGADDILSVAEMAPQGLGCIVQYFGTLPEGLPQEPVMEAVK